LQRDASSLRSRIIRRNLLEYAAGVAVIIGFGYCAWALPNGLVMRIGSAMLVLGTLVVMLQLHRQVSIDTKLPEQAALPSAAYLRQQLVRQRDAMRSVSRWYIGPLVPGGIVFIWGMPRHNPTDFPWLTASIFFILMWVITTTNDSAASQLQQEIDELDRAEL
jgi:hypothetical protein